MSVVYWICSQACFGVLGGERHWMWHTYIHTYTHTQTAGVKSLRLVAFQDALDRLSHLQNSQQVHPEGRWANFVQKKAPLSHVGKYKLPLFAFAQEVLWLAGNFWCCSKYTDFLSHTCLWSWLLCDCMVQKKAKTELCLIANAVWQTVVCCSCNCMSTSPSALKKLGRLQGGDPVLAFEAGGKSLFVTRMVRAAPKICVHVGTLTGLKH